MNRLIVEVALTAAGFVVVDLSNPFIAGGVAAEVRLIRRFYRRLTPQEKLLFADEARRCCRAIRDTW